MNEFTEYLRQQVKLLEEQAGVEAKSEALRSSKAFEEERLAQKRMTQIRDDLEGYRRVIEAETRTRWRCMVLDPGLPYCSLCNHTDPMPEICDCLCHELERLKREKNTAVSEEE